MSIGRYSARLSFFFQAEDGIRDLTVTGVQTCALPISPWDGRRSGVPRRRRGRPRACSVAAPAPLLEDHVERHDEGEAVEAATGVRRIQGTAARVGETRSEEGRVGKEWRTRGAPYSLKK